jgi:hypothetical protein
MANVAQLGCCAQCNVRNSGLLRQIVDVFKGAQLPTQIVAALRMYQGLSEVSSYAELQTRSHV